jgi:hypothetical protein
MQNFDFDLSVATGLRAQIAPRAIEMPQSGAHSGNQPVHHFPTRSHDLTATTRRDFPPNASISATLRYHANPVHSQPK